MAGTKIPNGIQKLDGRSLLPLLENPRATWSDRFLFVHRGRWKKGSNPDDAKYTACAVRTERFRLVNNKELYDIKADPGETTNVIDKHPDAVVKMRAAYDAWRAEARPLMVNEDVPLASERPFWVLNEKQLNGQGIPKWEPPQL